MGVLYLVRHGQASFGTDDYDRLSDTGHQQARITGAHLASLGVRPTRVDSGWNEYSAWSITGALSDTDPRASHDSRVFQDELERGIARWADSRNDGDYEETHSAFTTRVDRAFDDARAATGSGESTLIVSSAGSIGWTVARLMGGDFDQWMAFTRVTINTGITKIVTGRGGVSLVSFNEHTHQQPEMVTYR